MYIVESKEGAILCMLFSLFFLGTWPAVIASLERRGRLPQHTYLDYTVTNLLSAVFIALTLGQIGESKPNMPNFVSQLSQDNLPSVLFAIAGGVVLSVGNLATQYAWALVSLSVIEVVCSSITVVIGTTLNYFLDNKINKATILFSGVGCFLVAAFLGSAVHKSNAADNRTKLRNLPSDLEEAAGLMMPPESNDDGKDECGATILPVSNNYSGEDIFPANGTFVSKVGSLNIEKANETSASNFGTVKFLIQLEERRSIKAFGRSIWVELSITFFAGFCLSLFSPLFNLATNDQFHYLQKGVPHLVVYTAFFYFSVSCFVIAVILNVVFLYYPVLDLPKSSLIGYFSDWDGRWWACLAGLLSGFGNGLQFMGGQAAGYAAADAVQALPLVSTFWGVVIFGEYRKSSKRTYTLLISMLFMFVIAVCFLMASSGHRKS